jgi:hypothetical protein
MVLLWGWLLRGVEPPVIRRAALVLTLVLSTTFTGGRSLVPHYRQEDWRSAVQSVPEGETILLYSGLVETRRLDWLQAPDRWSYLAAPIVVYRPSVSPANTLLLPFEHGLSEQVYVENLITTQLHERETITVIARANFSGPTWVSSVTELLGKSKFIQLRSVDYGAVQVRTFRRTVLRGSATQARAKQG